MESEIIQRYLDGLNLGKAMVTHESVTMPRKMAIEIMHAIGHLKRKQKVIKAVYEKHVLGMEDIGWSELDDLLIDEMETEGEKSLAKRPRPLP